MPIGRLPKAEVGHFPVILGPHRIDAPDAITFAVAGKNNTVALCTPTGQTIFGIFRKAQQQAVGGIKCTQTGHIAQFIVED